MYSWLWFFFCFSPQQKGGKGGGKGGDQKGGQGAKGGAAAPGGKKGKYFDRFRKLNHRLLGYFLNVFTGGKK